MSFMKKVAKIAAPFASLIPGVGPFISAGLGVVGSLGGGGKKGKTDPQQQALLDAITKQNALAQQTYTTGKGLLDKGSQGIDDIVGKFYQPLLGGKDASNSVLAPAYQDIDSNYQQLLGNLGRSGASAGGAAGLLANARFGLGAQKARLRFGAQSDAASTLLGVGQNYLGAGAGVMGTGLGGINAGVNSLLGQRQLDLEKQRIHNEALGGLGGALGNLAGLLLMPGGIFNGGNSGGGGFGGILRGGGGAPNPALGTSGKVTG